MTAFFFSLLISLMPAMAAVILGLFYVDKLKQQNAELEQKLRDAQDENNVPWERYQEALDARMAAEYYLDRLQGEYNALERKYADAEAALIRINEHLLSAAWDSRD